MFKKRGWRQASVVALWQRAHQEALLLATSLEWEWEVIQLYKLRFTIEAVFRDFKSYGWQWEQSQAHSLETAGCQILLLAFATLLILVVGSGVKLGVELEGKLSLFYVGRLALQGYLLGTKRLSGEWELSGGVPPGLAPLL